MCPGKDVLASPTEIGLNSRLEIRQGEIHLWICSLDPTPEFLEVFKSSLSDKELKTSTFFSFPKDQVAYIASQGFLRIILSRYLSIDGRDLVFARHRKGKPYLINDTSLLYNISNSGQYVVVSISKHGEVGVDLEKVRPLDDFEDLVQKNFSPFERNYINKVHSEKLQRFFKLWTLKEAFLKAIGEGMRLTPDNLEFLIENGKFKLNSGPGFFEFEQWEFSDIKFGNDYVGSLAHLGSPGYISDLKQLVL